MSLLTPQQMLAFVLTSWDALAAFSWRHYQSSGRGVVRVHLWHHDPKKLHLDYMSEGSDLLQRNGGWPDEITQNVVASYDPESEVLFLFVLSPTRFEFCRMPAAAKLSPKEAFAANLDANLDLIVFGN